jgi:hypothetical protein
VRDLAKRTMTKLSKSGTTDPVVSAQLVGIVKDTYWHVFVVANLWVAWIESTIVPPRAAQFHSRNRCPDGSGIQSSLSKYACMLDTPDTGSAESEYLIGAMLLLLTTHHPRQLQVTRTATALVLWKQVWAPLCVVYARSLMSRELISEDASDAAGSGSGSGSGLSQAQSERKRRNKGSSGFSGEDRNVSPFAAGERKSAIVNQLARFIAAAKREKKGADPIHESRHQRSATSRQAKGAHRLRVEVEDSSEEDERGWRGER